MPYVNCPECGAEQLAPRELVGLLADCKKCGEAFRVADAAAPPRTGGGRKRHYQETQWPMIFGATGAACSVIGALVALSGSGEGGREAVGALAGLVYLAVGLPVYMAPTIVAVWRKHNNVAPILVVNLLLGCTLVGWAVALAWAVAEPPRRGRL